MPNFIQMSKKSEPNIPVPFAAIDVELCKVFNQPCDDRQYLFGWYDTIAMGLAFGSTHEKLRTIYADCIELVNISKYLEANYVVNAWAKR